VLHHGPHDGVGAAAVLLHGLRVYAQVLEQVGYALVGAGLAQGVRELLDQLQVHLREVVHEVERVLDLVGDPGGELAERGELFRLHELGLGRREVGMQAAIQQLAL
jgi:hypothetical protein